jgi:putative Mg2+ transporter-C (MgtC) family protein
MLAGWEIVGRITLAAVLGALIGLNRNLHHKYVGLRTMSLIGASTAALVIVSLHGPDGQLHVEAMSRTMQGILTGLGFLGAGVIVRGPDENHVHGLTTAATVWTTAILGTLCGSGAWIVLATLVTITAGVLVLGGPLERFAHRRLDRFDDDEGSRGH